MVRIHSDPINKEEKIMAFEIIFLVLGWIAVLVTMLFLFVIGSVIGALSSTIAALVFWIIALMVHARR